jgi:hypothetical protein
MPPGGDLFQGRRDGGASLHDASASANALTIAANVHRN